MIKALLNNWRFRLFALLAGVTLTAIAGWIASLPIGDSLGRLSYDLPFLWRRSQVPDDLVMVYIDTRVKTDLGQPPDQPLLRRFHAKLIDRLTHDGAKSVVYDILFDQRDREAADDDLFADAIKRHGKVVLAGYCENQIQGNSSLEAVVPPVDPLSGACSGWGLADILRDPDDALRVLYNGTEDAPSFAWVAASRLAPGLPEEVRLQRRWLNYYCSPAKLRAVNFDQALDTNLLSPDVFRNKIVLVGSRSEPGLAGAVRDSFKTPFSRVGEGFVPGAAIQAFSLMNLIRRDWITQLPLRQERAILLAWAVVITVILLSFRPWLAIGGALSLAILFALGAIYVQIHQRIWFAWLVPVAVQTPTALLWSIGFRYGIETRRRRQLRRAFSMYLSPYMADRIANSDFNLELGGTEIEATVMFTDLEGFTKMSESLPPAEVSRILTTYFNQTTQAILEQNGTIIKYIGDAVMAVWGAPLADSQHAEHAVIAAWEMGERSKKEVHGRRLRTRIGVNTGMVLAGNLGSDFRFDYTLIGDTTNFASRLEGLNKYLGTTVLISESTRTRLSDAIQTRYLGKFVVAGKKMPVGIYEVLGPANHTKPAAWKRAFETGLEAYSKRDLDEAENQMRETIRLKGEHDGPAEFYLAEIARARTEATTVPWSGAVVLDHK